MRAAPNRVRSSAGANGNGNANAKLARGRARTLAHEALSRLGRLVHGSKVCEAFCCARLAGRPA